MNEKGEEIKVVQTEKLYEMLDLIRRKPNMWLTSKSITSLQDFLNGYLMVRWNDESLYNPGDSSFADFVLWILEKGEWKFTKHNVFSSILLDENNGDEEKGFDKFFEYLETFINGKGKSIL
ncbi:hypothetical protein I5M27_11245 [Adhaeribacter sp. BT258]|uniref:Uncharacterized protein n=1 Tax=Adhaeribacter terrigena TaxID=2793070 RepID=A0ABS1C2D7_9BACT|nr:hypothetical protein [Adhaeribacter terrigena]MBK0403564.1 hypothetical protein [Adhaeribacter terrigena]